MPSVARSTEADIELTLDAAHGAKVGWGKTPAAERSRILNKIADLMEANLEMLAVAETWDNGMEAPRTRTVGGTHGHRRGLQVLPREVSGDIEAQKDSRGPALAALLEERDVEDHHPDRADPIRRDRPRLALLWPEVWFERESEEHARGDDGGDHDLAELHACARLLVEAGRRGPEARGTGRGCSAGRGRFAGRRVEADGGTRRRVEIIAALR